MSWDEVRPSEGGGPSVMWTNPDPITLHPITTEQVEALSRGPDDQSLNFSLGFGGMAAGFFQNVVSLINAVVGKSVPPASDVCLAFLCLALGGAAIAKFSEYRRNKPIHDALKKKILSRTVQGGLTHPLA
jgi:hypothetical protein